VVPETIDETLSASRFASEDTAQKAAPPSPRTTPPFVAQTGAPPTPYPETCPEEHDWTLVVPPLKNK
jgi:hypothetical protein